MGDSSGFEIGQTVELQDGRIAIVRFVGDTHFAPGDWIGVVLGDDSGKNDGSVLGHRYFECDPGHGMFVKPPAIATVLAQPTPKPIKRASGGPAGASVKSRPSSGVLAGLRRQSVDPTASKRQSFNAGSPTPGARATATKLLQSPSKSPTKQLTSRPASGATLRNPPHIAVLKPTSIAPKLRTSISGRPPMGPPISTASRGSRPSISGALNGPGNASNRPTVAPLRKPANRLSMLQQHTQSVSSVSRTSSQTSGRSGLESPRDGDGGEPSSPSSDKQINGKPSPDIHTTSHNSAPKSLSAREKASPAVSQRGPTSSIALNKEIEDLKTKLRLMEKKRMEDREKLKSLDKIQGERDKFETIIQKLQAKYQPQQQEIADLKKQIKEAEIKLELCESQQGDIDATIEMATLDREMAEETAEALKMELETLRQRYEELELEVEILREENSELGKEMSPEEKTSQGWMQMERSNERLREALLRLRDMTQEQEAELKQQVKELESDVQKLERYRDQYEDTKERLAQSDSVIEDLRQQLEAALGAEEMIEELTEKNMSLTEQMDELRAAIDDLESLKELNDELEINHIETEKQMQDELDYNESVLADQLRKAAAQDETIDDLEYTVSRFRELVTNLQSDLEDMRASQQITENEANELSSRSRAMLDLNMRLQVSASKTQIKAVDLELRKLEAQESAEHLAIVQLFLPQSYSSERNSVNSLLRFKRIGFKANLLHGFIKERVNGVTVPGHEDDIFTCCEILDKLSWVTAMCDRFAKFIRSCSLDAFKRLDGVLYDLEPVERALNGWIDGLKRDELKEQQCAAELHRSIAVMTHLAERHIGEGLKAYAEDVHMRAILMQSNLENAAVALAHIKAIAHNKIPTLNGEEIGDDEEEALLFLQRADASMATVRSAKVISGKAIRQLEELESRSLTLEPSTLSTIEQSQALTLDIVEVSRLSGLSLCKLINEEDRKSPFTYDEIARALSANDSSPFFTLSSKAQAAAVQMQAFHNLTTTLTQTTEFPSPSPSPPWEVLSQILKAETTATVEFEKDIGRLKDELCEKNTALAMKDKIVEEMCVNVEVLEKRISESGGRKERLKELEIAIEASSVQEKGLNQRISRLEEQLASQKSDIESYSSQVSQFRRQEGSSLPSTGTPRDGIVPVRALEDIAVLKNQLSSLQATIKYLHQSTHQQSLASAYSFLDTPLVPKAGISKEARLAHEARDALRSMLELVTRPESTIVQLRKRDRGDRLAWRSKHDEPKCQVRKQREKWEVWREWKDDVGKQRVEMAKEMERMKVVGRKREEIGEVLARVDMRILGIGFEKVEGGTVQIVKPDDWEGIERRLGLAF